MDSPRSWRRWRCCTCRPIRALLNNQEERIGSYARMVGRRAFKWHGDVSDVRARAFRARPQPHAADHARVARGDDDQPAHPTRALLAGLQTVVIDEVHAFAGDDRGAHLAALLERIAMFVGATCSASGCRRRSATRRRSCGGCRGARKRAARVVDPGGAEEAPSSLDYVASVENAATVIQRGCTPARSASSSSTRAAGRGARASCSSDQGCSRSSRTARSRSPSGATPSGLREGRDCVIVATSALELGIDVGDLDHVLQIDSPRAWRASSSAWAHGAARGHDAQLHVPVHQGEMVLQAAALVQLFREGFVEAVAPHRRAAHISRTRSWRWASSWVAWRRRRGCVAQRGDGVRGLTADERAMSSSTCCARSILADHGGGYGSARRARSATGARGSARCMRCSKPRG
jgi:ATP-dependent Lhr-like helicase